VFEEVGPWDPVKGPHIGGVGLGPCGAEIKQIFKIRARKDKLGNHKAATHQPIGIVDIRVISSLLQEG
jgi:hypothetical protein